MFAISSDCDMDEQSDEEAHRLGGTTGTSTDSKLGQLQNQRRLNLVSASRVVPAATMRLFTVSYTQHKCNTNALGVTAAAVVLIRWLVCQVAEYIDRDTSGSEVRYSPRSTLQPPRPPRTPYDILERTNWGSYNRYTGPLGRF